jgi:DNA-binding PucR family transcriptional regulator
VVSERLPSVSSELGRWLQGVAHISAAVNTKEPLGNVLDAVAETTCRLLRYDFSAVLLVDEAHERLLITGAHGLSESYIASVNSERPFRLGPGPYGEGPSSRAFRSREPVTIRDAQIDPAFVPWAGVAVEQGYRSLAAIPLVVSGEAIGTLVSYTRSVHEFSPEELLLLETMANQAAAAITAARLHEQEQATIKRLEEARGSLEAQTHLLERSEEIHAELTGVVLADSGLAAIAAALARILSGSVVIAEPAGTVLAAAAFGAIPTGLAEIVGDPAALAARLLEPREPVELRPGDDPAVAGRTFVAPVTIGREVVARLWVLQPTGDLGALERRALEHGATVVALELLKQRIASEVEARLRGDLLADILDRRLSDTSTLQARASHLHLDLNARHAAVVLKLDSPVDGDLVSANDAGLNRRMLAIASATLRRLRVPALAGERDGLVVILVSEATTAGTRTPADIAEAVRRDARRGLPGAVASAAIGPWVDRITDVPRSFHIARGAIEVSRRGGSRDRVIKLEDLGVYGLLLTVGDLDELVGFANKTLGPIRAYDGKRGSELLPTLRAYLDCSCRTAAAAAALDVHPNTVAYRIHRIETILGVDLTQPEILLRIQLALVLDGVAGVEARPEAGPGTA